METIYEPKIPRQQTAESHSFIIIFILFRKTLWTSVKFCTCVIISSDLTFSETNILHVHLGL